MLGTHNLDMGMATYVLCMPFSLIRSLCVVHVCCVFCLCGNGVPLCGGCACRRVCERENFRVVGHRRRDKVSTLDLGLR